MAFNINNFKTNINDFGYMKTNLFEVFILPPPILIGNAINNNGNAKTVKDLTEMQTFRIDQLKAPGLSLASADVNRWNVGPTQKQPFNAQFSEISMSILSDSKAAIWNYWYNWVNSIFEANGWEDTTRAVINEGPKYSTEYKSKYATTMQILMYDQTGRTVQKINLIEAFPTSLREIPLAWGDNGTLAKINVSIAYSYFTQVATNINTTT